MPRCVVVFVQSLNFGSCTSYLHVRCMQQFAVSTLSGTEAQGDLAYWVILMQQDMYIVFNLTGGNNKFIGQRIGISSLPFDCVCYYLCNPLRSEILLLFGYKIVLEVPGCIHNMGYYSLFSAESAWIILTCHISHKRLKYIRAPPFLWICVCMHVTLKWLLHFRVAHILNLVTLPPALFSFRDRFAKMRILITVVRWKLQECNKLKMWKMLKLTQWWCEAIDLIYQFKIFD